MKTTDAVAPCVEHTPDDWVLRLTCPEDPTARSEMLVSHEWLVTNGLGGYASGTLAGVSSRRYHCLLIAGLPTPLGRRVMLNHLSEWLRLSDGSVFHIGGEERAGGNLQLPGAQHLTEFRLEKGLPVWRYVAKGFAVEKRVFMPHRQNTVHVHYRLVAGQGAVRLKLRPSIHFRPHDAPVSEHLAGPYLLTCKERRYEVSGGQDLPPLRLYLHGDNSAFTLDGRQQNDILYRVEESRGYEFLGALWSPGYFRVDLSPGRDATLVGSTESWETILALRPSEALKWENERRRRLVSLAHPEVRTASARDYVLAADQFLICPTGRVEDAARAMAAGDEVRTVIAGYHWFTDWGRDTMISLEGLTLTTDRKIEAGYILRTFGHYVHDGLIPNLFPEGEKEGLYHTADATMWFFHAIDRYLAATEDRETLKLLLPKLLDIVEHHLKGTRFGIGVDPKDGLLRQGADGYQLTWMDAKVGDWVVTPRRGKAVEINALWYNALKLLEGWVRELRGAGPAESLTRHAERARRSFNERFWYGQGGYLYDVVDGEKGDDPSLRPNQVFAFSLEHPILAEERWKPVLDVVTKTLLTPVGLRSLAPGSPDYKPKYYGDLRSRDAAYHQGTVWAWLIGPYIDAYLRVYPNDKVGARKLLVGFQDHLAESCVGSISEIFDAEPPYTPRGCIAQAWSVAEVLRCLAKTAG